MRTVNEAYIKPLCQRTGLSVALSLNPAGRKLTTFVSVFGRSGRDVQKCEIDVTQALLRRLGERGAARRAAAKAEGAWRRVRRSCTP